MTSFLESGTAVHKAHRGRSSEDVIYSVFDFFLFLRWTCVRERVKNAPIQKIDDSEVTRGRSKILEMVEKDHH